jgi:signal transduction histidine kinase/ligand-binding sensor domain-containing protein
MPIMRHATLKRCVLSPALFLVVLARGYCQQAVSWRDFNMADGFPDTAFHSVTIAESGAVLAVGSASSRVCLFDGYEAKSLPLPEGAARVYQSPAGQLWTISAQGLWPLKDQQWKFYSLPDLAAVPHARQISLCLVRLNVVLCLLPERLVECSAEDPAGFSVQTLRAAARGSIGRFTSMAIGIEDDLWIVGERGLARLSGPRRNLTASSEWREFIPPESLHLQHLQHPQPDGNGVTLVADSSADNQSRVVRFDGEQWQAQAFGAAHLSFAWRGPDGSYWACSSNHLFQINGANMALDSSLPNRQYYDVAVDWRGTFWLATSAGLARFTPGLWQPAPADEKINATVQSLVHDGRWPEAPGQIARFDMDPARTAVTASGQGATRLKPIGLMRDGRVCYATLPAKDSNQRNRLEVFDGTNFQALPIFVPQPAATADLSCFLATQSGDLWLGGDFGTAWLHGRWVVFPASERGAPEGMCHLVELPSGQIWSASREKIWNFDGKDWSLVRAGFNHLNAMICARDGSVWVGCDSGVIRFIKGHWIENGTGEGLNGAVRALGEDQRGSIWAATDNGVALYHPEADTDPPRTLIAPMSDKERNIPEDGVIVVKFGGRDKWDGTSRDRLLYSYRLDTGEWSPFAGADNMSFSDLPAGKHYFQVRAMDRAGNIDPDPAELDFAIVLPWYKESRLVLIASAGAVAAGFFAVLAWRRHRELALSYAQVGKQVAERTRELELASQELLQSQKMRALGTLAAGIAHDFNNILSIVKGSAQIIEDNLDNPGKIRTRTDRIKSVVNQGSAVVQAMLGFSRGSDEILETCEINPVVDNTLKLLGDRFLREAELRFDRAPALPCVRASQSLVQQILLNFIFNAAESMNGRKRVIITTGHAGLLPSRMALQPGAAAAYVTVAVRDFGCGIPPEHVPRVFEPFFTTKAFSTRRGTGLGLSIVYELAKKMEAGLAVESTVDQGSVFSLFLPVIPKIEPAPPIEP